MKRSVSICTGLRALTVEERKSWKGEINRYDVCALAGRGRHAVNQMNIIRTGKNNAQKNAKI